MSNLYLEKAQRNNLLRGALFSIKTQKESVNALKRIALWIALEDSVGDKEFSFEMALTIPKACEHIQTESKVLKLFDQKNAERLLNKTRTIFYIFCARSFQLQKDVI